MNSKEMENTRIFVDREGVEHNIDLLGDDLPNKYDTLLACKLEKDELVKRITILDAAGSRLYDDLCYTLTGD